MMMLLLCMMLSDLFVSVEILENSIKTASEYGAYVATVPAVDTMYVLDENGFISGFPDRKTLFNGQAPDSFKVGVLTNALNSLTEEERKTITGTVQICSAKGYKIKTIAGDYKNIKITTENDLSVAEGILKKRKKMKACVLKDKNNIVYEDVETPSPKKGEVLVKVLHAVFAAVILIEFTKTVHIFPDNTGS